MPSLKDLRNRITSVKSTQKITKAMQMVAASKLRRAQASAEAARPYADKVETVLGNLAGAAGAGGQAPRLLAGNGSDKTQLLIVCTGERGLCGAFNTAIVRLARERINRLIGEGKTVKILCIGKKGYDQLKRTHEKNILTTKDGAPFVDLRAVRVITYGAAQPIAQRVLAMFDDSEFDVCTLFYSRFRSVISQIPTALQLIPPELPAKNEQAPSYDYEPDEGEILDQLLPQAVTVRVYRALLENNASFFGAQMSAMDSATRNAGEMVKKYTLRYNRTRQAMITKELIEIISGAEAL